jgi:hypothetical protein
VVCVDVIATTARRVGMPVRSRYLRNAWCGCTAPQQVSLSVYTMNVSTSTRFCSAHTMGAAQSVAPKLSRDM